MENKRGDPQNMSNTFQHQVCYSFFIRLNIVTVTGGRELGILYWQFLMYMNIYSPWCQFAWLLLAKINSLTHVGEKKPCLIDQQPGPTLRFRPLKKVILRPLRSLWRSCAADPMLGVLEEHQDEWLQLTIWKRSLFSINKKWQLLKCGVCQRILNHLSSFGLATPKSFSRFPCIVFPPAGTCAGGLLGEPCAVCPDGKTWWGEACEDCQFSILYWLGALLLALLCLPSGYFIANVAVAWMHLHSLNS